MLSIRLPDAVQRRLTPGIMSLLDQALVSGFGFLTGIATARLVGLAQFGRFTLVLIFISLAQNVHNAVVTAPMMTLVGSRPHRSRAYFASFLAAALLLSLVAGVIVAILLGGLFAFRGDELSLDFLIAAAVTGTAQNFQFTVRRLLFATSKGMQAVVMDGARTLAFPVAIALLLVTHSKPTVDEIMWLLAVTALATTLPFALPMLKGRRRALHLGTVVRRHEPLARWLLPVVLVTFGQEQLVWILAGATLGDDAVGGLRAAQYVVGLILLMLTATENVIPVGAARAFTEGARKGLNRYLLRTGAKLGALIAIPLLAVGIPAEFWLRLIFGATFVPFADCLRILALAAAFIHVRDMATHVFRATQRTGVIFRAFTVSLAVSLLCLHPLLVHGGLIGAATVVLIGHATSMLYMLIAAANPDLSFRQLVGHLVPRLGGRQEPAQAPPHNGHA